MQRSTNTTESPNKDATLAVIFVIGAPGAGKGTLCKRIADKFNLAHVSVGDTLRRAVQAPDADPTLVDYVRRSVLLPMDMLTSILRPHIQRSQADNSSDHGEAPRVVLLDGFPRRMDQALAFEEAFGPPRLVLFFDCPRDLAEQRVVERQLGREGDNHETFRKRYDEFAVLNPPVMAHFGDKLLKVDTSGPTEASYAKLLDLLASRPGWNR